MDKVNQALAMQIGQLVMQNIALQAQVEALQARDELIQSELVALREKYDEPV